MKTTFRIVKPIIRIKEKVDNNHSGAALATIPNHRGRKSYIRHDNR